ncbi:hypothetical protein PITCH_A1800029 [uncultured Desulfobacterium sp.]|uniref:IrrE N-terminal-like domain-containing protein n=1 Tax=uncultured Desulfobacterium sp. TaxID=201089 RepID=A0A445MV72_9BACT|nr:hypothetical protein PITCH_A1800029 [uncultured Desulfobacterium sp.]
MKESHIMLHSLLGHLKDIGIILLRVDDNSMMNKALAKFSFDLSSTASIVCGDFNDGLKELTSIAHEAGHVLIHKKMSRDETRDYVCIMFVINKLGVDKISPEAQEFILKVEAEASRKGFQLLTNIGVQDGELLTIKQMMKRWYASYECMCHEKAVSGAREKILTDNNPVFCDLL